MNLRLFLDPLFLTTLVGSLLLLGMLLVFLFEDISFESEPDDPGRADEILPIGRRPTPSTPTSTPPAEGPRRAA